MNEEATVETDDSQIATEPIEPTEPDYKERYEKLKGDVLNCHLDEKLTEVAPNIPRSSIDAAIRAGMNPQSSEVYAKVLQGHYDRGQTEFKSKTKDHLSEIENAAREKAEATVREAWGSPAGGSSSGGDTSPLTLEKWVSQGSDPAQVHRIKDNEGRGK